MNEEQLGAFDTEVTDAKALVDHLISIASGYETAEWMAKYIAIQKALAAGSYLEAVREEWKLVDYRIKPKWIVSRELAERLQSAINNLARKLRLPNHGVVEICLDNLPARITDLGTLAEEQVRIRQAFRESIKRDPLDDDPAFADVLNEASRLAEVEVEYPKDSLGYCVFYWLKKQEILRERYGLKWKTPAELNPHVIFD